MLVSLNYEPFFSHFLFFPPIVYFRNAYIIPNGLSPSFLLSFILLKHHLFRLISYFVYYVSFISRLRNVQVLSHSRFISEQSLILLRVMILFQRYVLVPLKSCLISVPLLM